MQQLDSSQNLRKCRLIMVSDQNNNKYYEMSEKPGGMFSVVYGRVGAKGAEAEYPVSQWKKKYNEKIRKGYQDQTHLFKDKKENVIDFDDITEATVNLLMKDLYQYSNKSMEDHYNVTADQVTKQQLEEAQTLLNDLAGRIKPRMQRPAFNVSLLKLYGIIPRKMSNVKDHLVTTKMTLDEINKLIASEQETLDVMRSQFEMVAQNDDAEEVEKISILKKLGITIEEEHASKSIKRIKKMMGVDKDLFYKAYKVSNIRTEGNFNNTLATKRKKSTELFWHGSRNENWMSILGTGLVLRPTNAIITGKMFGYGLYFADKFKKSLNYTSYRGAYWSGGNSDKAYLAIYEVHTGNQLKTKNHESWHYNLDETMLKSKGDYDSLYAKGGADLINNEYIIYNENQCTVRYLVEIRK
ncbi:MAG: ADP-ribose polymerase [Thalassobius sp.]|nr:ADP-ribose polymerase [Thalassovita sp.]